MSELTKEYEYLMGLPDGEFSKEVYAHWGFASPLFGFCTPSEVEEEGLAPWSSSCNLGCLTMVAEGANDVAWTQDLTEKIRADDRIPTEPWDITKDNLHVFLEWQERMEHYFIGETG